MQNGGLLQPPVPFDPGWRFLLVPLITMLSAGTATLVAGGVKPRLALMLPLPLTVAASLVQDPAQELWSGAVALVLGVAALMVLANAEIRGVAEVSRGFELRRNLRGAAALAALVVALGGLNQAGFLFPQPVKSRVAEAQKPQVVAITQIKDKPLFVARTKSKGPWRLGVLDVYKDNAFLLPPYDTSRFRTLPGDGHVHNAAGSTEKVTFVMKEPSGHSLPVFGDPVRIQVAEGSVSYDPRAQTARVLNFIPPSGYHVTVEAPVAPTGQQLEGVAGAPAPQPELLAAPPVPSSVEALLASAPKNPWERVQYVRNAFYQKVVASGSGKPVDVPPSRVESMLAGGTATPYEITAGEVLLTRWAGVPARLAFGYYGGRQVPDGYEIHPQDGANWLEAYFQGYGWVSVFGVPPRAKATLTDTQHNRNVVVRPSEDINVEAYIPIALDNPLFLYEVVQYWVLVTAGPAALLVLGLIFYPWPLKMLRARRRRRWARLRGGAERIAVAYAELRDLATDLHAAGRWDTPLEFLDRVDADAEHEELAWLVTRALWGDLQRDLLDADVAAAAKLSGSVRRRLAGAQPVVQRLLAAASRASLREPYDAGLPNLWRRPRLLPAPAGPRRTGLRATLAAATAAVFLLTSCGAPAMADSERIPAPPASFPARILPPGLNGLAVQEETNAEVAYRKAGSKALVSDGRIFSLHRGGIVKGVLQVEVFKPENSTLDIKLRRGVRLNIGNSHFKNYRVKGMWVGGQDLPDETIFVWFLKELDVFEVLTLRSDVQDQRRLVSDVLTYQGVR
jgi:transglutaminase-like putative cysteine protease